MATERMVNLKVSLSKRMIAYLEREAKAVGITFNDYVCNIIHRAQEAKLPKNNNA